MTGDCGLEIKLARLEEKLSAAQKALELAQSGTHALINTVISTLAILLSLVAIFRGGK